MSDIFHDTVVTKYNIFNSLFLSLPYKGIFQTGSILPLITQRCEEGFAQGKSPVEIIDDFFDEFRDVSTEKQRIDLLFSMIKYIERQVVLFDSVEDAAFDKTHDLDGKGSVNFLLNRIESQTQREKLLKKLQDFSVRIVLTAHPTQFYPGKVLGIINDLEGAIRENDFATVNRLLLQLGKTGFINREKPTPYEEAVSLCWFLERVYYDAISEIIWKITENLKLEAHTWEKPHIFQLGFWPGGDRDGNPFVDKQATLDVAERLRTTLLRAYYRDIRLLKRRLTFKGVEDYIVILEKKMNYTIFGPEEKGYKNVDEVLAELLKAREILVRQHEGLFVEYLDKFILKLRIFGFHFASLDIRQVSTKHQKAWEDILRRLESKVPLLKYDEYAQWDDQKKIELLLSLNIPLRIDDYEDVITKDILGSIHAVKKIQKRNGPLGSHRYIISNCSSALNVIEVYAFAKNLIKREDGVVPLDIVPLFETIDDLAHAPGVMRALYEIPEYRAHLANRDHKQTIMVGFSDGTKDGGYLRANWSIFVAKEELTRVSREFGVKVIFFDGRGGPPGRGGGNSQDFYASLGKDIEDIEIQLTVQGQTISSNYGTVLTAMYNLERLFTAGLESHLFEGTVEGRSQPLDDADKALLEELAEISYNSYLKLKNHPSFVPFLELRTPLRFYGLTNIGSRPTKRSKEGEGLRFEDLRAIPFVGSWSQMKQNVPGFYGFGEAIEELKRKGKLDDLKKLYRKSLFFRTLIENSMQSLSKSFFPVTQYLQKEPQFKEFWTLIYEEYQRTTKALLELAGHGELLDSNAITKESIKIRERIVLPLITIQQYALQLLAENPDLPPEKVEICNKLIIRSMFGIINAARNSA